MLTMNQLIRVLLSIHLLLVLNLNILTSPMSMDSVVSFDEDQSNNSTTDPDLSKSSNANNPERSEADKNFDEDVCLSILTPFMLINQSRLLYETNGLLSKAPNPTLGTIVPPPEFS